MAAVTELCFLLFALINNIHAEELFIIRKEGHSHAFTLPNDSDSCLISRFVGEEKLVLWNTSDLWSQNSTLPEDLKQRLSVENNSSYVIRNLNHSDSGPYQEECWTDGKLTHERNISLIVCSKIGIRVDMWVRLGDTAELQCGGAADNLDVLWLKREFSLEKKQEFRNKELIWSRVFGDSPTSVMDDVKGRYQVVKNTSALRVSNTTGTDIGEYNCLMMNQQQQCVSRHRAEYGLDTELMYSSEEETAVLPCDVTDSTHQEPPQWIKDRPSFTVLGQENHTEPSVDRNYSLVFSSLMLSHSGWYTCKISGRSQWYELMVCPEFGPPAVEFFSEGEDVTLTCKDQEKGWRHRWFIKSNRTEGKIFEVESGQSRLSRVSWDTDGNVFISDVSQKDSGEYWCAVTDGARQCVSTTRYVVQYRGRYRDQYGEPFGVHSTFYKVRCSVLSVLLLMLCVVVVAVNQWARRIKQE